MATGNQIFLIPGLRLRRGTSSQGDFVGALNTGATIVGEFPKIGSVVGELSTGAVMVGEFPKIGSVVGTLNTGATMVGEVPSAFTPLDLFAGGEEGAWYDPSDLSTLFQDAAGLTPVTTDGDPVRLMRDKSGRDNHATAPSDAARPVYKTLGGLHWLEFNGPSHELNFDPKISGTQARTVCLGQASGPGTRPGLKHPAHQC